MKKISLIFISICFCLVTEAQETVIKTSAVDAAFGRYEVSYERTINEGMNNIKSSGRLKKQGKWPNIMTKHSILINVGHVNESIKQSFGQGLIWNVDTNSNDDHDRDPDNGVIEIIQDPAEHSLQRDIHVRTKGFYIGAEYRSYIKTYKQRIGDAPRGWYFAPFVEFKIQNVDFDDNTTARDNEALQAMLDPYWFAYQGNDFITGSYQAINNPNYDYRQTPEFYDALFAMGLEDFDGDGIIEPGEGTNPNGLAFQQMVWNRFGWRDVSHKYSEFAMTGGIVIGRQWLFWDKIAVDVQAGPQYKYLTRSKRIFNANDTWNANNQVQAVGTEQDFFNKYFDVYNPTDDDNPLFWDYERLGNYYGILDYNGDLISIRDKGSTSESQMRFNTGFNGDYDGLTDFTKLFTYRIKVKIGYSF